MSQKIAAKLLAVQRELAGRIEKTGRMSGPSGNYGFVEEAELAAEFGRAANMHGLVLLTETKLTHFDEKTRDSGKKFFLATVELVGTFVDADSGESLRAQSVGQGADSADKAVSKGTTSAYKYLLLKCLALSDRSDDPDHYNSVDGAKTLAEPAPKRIAAPEAAPPQRPESTTLRESTAKIVDNRKAVEALVADYAKLKNAAGIPVEEQLKPAGLRALFAAGATLDEVFPLAPDAARKLLSKLKGE